MTKKEIAENWVGIMIFTAFARGLNGKLMRAKNRWNRINKLKYNRL